MKKWGSVRSSGSKVPQKTNLPASAFMPRQRHAVGHHHSQHNGAILASGNWNHMWEGKNARSWAEKLQLEAGSDGPSQEVTHPAATERRWGRSLLLTHVRCPHHPDTCPAPNAGNQKANAFRESMGSWGFETLNHIYRSAKVNVGLEALGNHCVTF